MSDKNYTEIELNEIAANIVQTKKQVDDNLVYLQPKTVVNDWDEEKFISENLYEDYLKAVQQEYILDLTFTFEKWLEKALKTLAHRREELKQELLVGQIDQQTYNNAKMVADMAETAIKHYLEKSDRKRLIGV